MNKMILSLTMFREKGRILLGLKKEGFGAGRWNGFGGKLEGAESIEECARRETREEIGVEIEAMEKIGTLTFVFQGKPEEPLEVHIFDVRKYSGQPQEIEKLIPRWFDVKEIPFGEMWPDDPFWYPLYFSGKKFRGSFLFDEKGDEVQKVNLEVVDEI